MLHKYWRIIRKMILFDAPRQFLCQSPNNLSVHGGNGNTLKKRRQQSLKINIHRSSWSENNAIFPNPIIFSFYISLRGTVPVFLSLENILLWKRSLNIFFLCFSVAPIRHKICVLYAEKIHE
jgi:hypothetical protein